MDSFNVELKDDDGFVGNRAAKGAFREILDDLRKPLKRNGEDPSGRKSAEKISNSELDQALLGGDIGAAARVVGAIEEFARELACVTSHILKAEDRNQDDNKDDGRKDADEGKRGTTSVEGP